VGLLDDGAGEGRAATVDVAVVVDAHHRRTAPVGRRQPPVEAAHVALHPALIQDVEGDDPATRAAPLHGPVHLHEVQRGVARAVVGRLARVVGFVPDAEVADAQCAEVADQPSDVVVIFADRRQVAALDGVVVGRDVQQHLEPFATRALDVRASHQTLLDVVHDVPRDQVPHALEVRPLERGVVEHRDLLIADSDADRDPRRRRRSGADAGEQGRDGHHESTEHAKQGYRRLLPTAVSWSCA
jgi:hypothetical protein